MQDFLGKSDPFLQVSKVKADGGTLLVHRTEVNMTHMYLDPPYYGTGFLHQKKTCPTLPSTGPIFAGKGTGHFSSSGEQIRSWYRINNKLFCEVIGPISVPNDYLNALFNDVIILHGGATGTMFPTGKASTCCNSLSVCEKSFLSVKEYAICKPPHLLEAYSLAMDI